MSENEIVKEIQDNKRLRNELYYKAENTLLSIYKEKNQVVYLCDCLNSAIELTYETRISIASISIAFKEFAKYKPSSIRDTEPWWGDKDIDIRVKVIRQCIEETSNESN